VAVERAGGRERTTGLRRTADLEGKAGLRRIAGLERTARLRRTADLEGTAGGVRVRDDIVALGRM